MPRHHAPSRTNRPRVQGRQHYRPRLEALERRAMLASLYADFNNDGWDDLAVGAPDTNVGAAQNAGAVRVIYGSRNGLTPPSVAFTQDNLSVDTSQTGDHFGIALAAGDFNNDSWDDLTIGADKDIGTAIDAGAVYVVYGSRTGLNGDHVEKWSQDSPGIVGESESLNHFGRSLASGDFNGDSRDDLAIGVPDEDLVYLNEGVFAGGVNVIYGSAAGLSASGSQFWSQNSPGILGVPNPSRDFNELTESFGHSLAVGDFDGDGRDDLAIGVPGEVVGSVRQAGAVNVIYGSFIGLSASNNQIWTQNNPGIGGVAEQKDRFGWSLAAGDFNGDGRDDLAIGVPDEDLGSVQNAGAVNVIYGTAFRLTAANNQVWTQDSPGILGAAEQDDLFGWSLAAGDFNGDGRDDLAIGVPLEDVTTGLDAGAVNVVYGVAFIGLTASGNQAFTLNTLGCTANSGDNFGTSLAVGDYDGDGVADLAIGSPWRDVIGIPDAGAVAVVYGSSLSGLDANDSEVWTLFNLGILNFGSSLFGYGL